MNRAQPCVVLTLLAALVLLSSGCASIVHGSGQEVPISSDPTGADVYVDGEDVGKTPVTPNLKRKRAHQVTFEKPGYRTEHRVIHRVLSGAVAGNILAGGLIGWGVDAVTGAQWRLVPEQLHAELDKLPEGATAVDTADPALHPQTRLSALKAACADGAVTDDEAAALRRCITAELTGEAQPTAGPPPDVRILDLWDLYQQDLITEKEYLATKKQILATSECAKPDENADLE